MMRSFCPAIVIALSILPAGMVGAAELKPPEIKVGRNLQVSAAIRLPQPAPDGGLQIALTSDDPTRYLLSRKPLERGSAAITLTVKANQIETPEYWVQAIGEIGSGTYTVTAPGFAAAKGTVSVGPAGIVIYGPFKAPSFQSTPRSPLPKITIHTALLDSSLNIVEEQMVAGGLDLTISMISSNPQVGSAVAVPINIAAGTSSVDVRFKPASVGKTTISVKSPLGFSTPAEAATVIAVVEEPGIALVDGVFVGNKMQTPGLLCLGEPAPPEGLEVRLTSSDPGKLRLAANEKDIGAAAITLKVPGGRTTVDYFMQGFADSGTVAYRGEAQGFRSRTAKITLAPGGVIVAFSPYGAPDRAAVERAPNIHEVEDTRSFSASLSDSKRNPLHMTVYTVYVDPVTGKAADTTVQWLRPDLSLTVHLKSSDPSVATVNSPITIAPGTNHFASRLTPLSVGQTVISIETPPGFTAPKNATKVPATVRD